MFITFISHSQSYPYLVKDIGFLLFKEISQGCSISSNSLDTTEPSNNALLSSHCMLLFTPPYSHLTRLYLTRSQQRITIVGAHLAPEEPEEDPLFLGVFKPKDGVREKLRETLHNVLAVEMAERAKEVKIEEEGVTSSPNAVTISKNTRYAALSTAGYDITAGYDLHVNTDVTLQILKCLAILNASYLI